MALDIDGLKREDITWRGDFDTLAHGLNIFPAVGAEPCPKSMAKSEIVHFPTPVARLVRKLTLRLWTGVTKD